MDFFSYVDLEVLRYFLLCLALLVNTHCYRFVLRSGKEETFKGKDGLCSKALPGPRKTNYLDVSHLKKEISHKN